MIKQADRKVNRLKRHKRVRVHVNGTKERPRLAVFRSLNHVYAQPSLQKIKRMMRS